MARRARKDIESQWYDVFAKWRHADRTAALKVLETLHRALPADPKPKVKIESPAQTALPGTRENA